MFAEFISRTVPHTLIDESKFIAYFCYGIMSQAIRSEVDKQLISLCCQVILNLARYEPTKENAFQVSQHQLICCFFFFLPKIFLTSFKRNSFYLFFSDPKL